MLSVLGLCFATLVAVYVAHWYLKWRNPKCSGVLPPGSMGLPVIGVSLQLFSPGYSLDLHPFTIRDSKDERTRHLLACLMSLPLNVPGTTYYKALKDHKEIRKVLNGVVKERLSLRERERGNEDLLDHAINKSDSEQFLTEEFIFNLMFALLNASYTSVSTTLALVFKFLSEHPVALEKLTAEHENILRNRKTRDSVVTWEEYKQMTFTRQVINETLRRGHISPGLLRRTLKDIQVKGNAKGYTIPAGWAIVVVTAAQHLNPETFSDPLTFNPWRWKELDSSIVSKNFTPFGGGTRQCAGAEYSKAFMSIFLHVLVTKYRWKKIRGGDIIRNPF